MHILHLSADFPDHFDPYKTRAISTLVELVDSQFDQEVISLNRVAPPIGRLPGLLLGRGSEIAETCREGSLFACRYFGLSKGLFHHTCLMRLVDALFERLEKSARPSLIVGHKLTVEGIVAAELAARFGIPYAITIQGDTDTKILGIRRDLAPLYARILHGAAVVFPLAPWALEAVERRLGPRRGPVVYLPCPVKLDRPVSPRPGSNGMLTAFHLRSYRRKNLARTVDALGIAQRQLPELSLRVVGGGTEAERKEVGRIAGRNAGVRLVGPVGNPAMPESFAQSSCFVMPSLRESFGMVFIEALFCGTPIIYPAGRAVQGYFDNKPFAIGVDPKDCDAISEAMLRLGRFEAPIKQELASWQLSNEARRFQRDAIAEAFADGLRVALSADRSAKTVPDPNRAAFGAWTGTQLAAQRKTTT